MVTPIRFEALRWVPFWTVAAPVYLLASELKRGSACSADFSLVDHFALAPLPLSEVRQQFNVGRPLQPSPVDHLFWDCWRVSRGDSPQYRR